MRNGNGSRWRGILLVLLVIGMGFGLLPPRARPQEPPQEAALFSTVTVGQLVGVRVDATQPPEGLGAGLVLGLGADLNVLAGNVTVRKVSPQLAQGLTFATESGGRFSRGTYCYLVTTFIDDREAVQQPGAFPVAVGEGKRVVLRWRVAPEVRQAVRFGARAGYRVYRAGPLAEGEGQCPEPARFGQLAELPVTDPEREELSFTDEDDSEFVGGAPQLVDAGNLTVEGDAAVGADLTVGQLAAVGALQVGPGPAPAPGDAAVAGNVTVGGLTAVGALQVGPVPPPAVPGPSNVAIAGNASLLGNLGVQQNLNVAGRVGLGAPPQPGARLTIAALAAVNKSNLFLDATALQPGGRRWELASTGAGAFELWDATLGRLRLQVTGPGGNVTFQLGDPTAMVPGQLTVEEIFQTPSLTRLQLGSSASIGISDPTALGSFSIEDLLLAETRFFLSPLGEAELAVGLPVNPIIAPARLGRFALRDLVLGEERLTIDDQGVLFRLGNPDLVSGLISKASGRFVIEDLNPDVPKEGKLCGEGKPGNPRFALNEEGKASLGVAPQGGPAGALEIAHSLGVGIQAPEGCGDLAIAGKASIKDLEVLQNARIDGTLRVEKEARLLDRVAIGLDLGRRPGARLHLLAQRDDPFGLWFQSQTELDAFLEATQLSENLDLLLGAGVALFDVVTYRDGGLSVVDCAPILNEFTTDPLENPRACRQYARDPDRAALLIQDGQIKLFNASGPPQALGPGALYFDAAPNPATGDPANTLYFWDGGQWVPLRGLKCWDLDGDGRPGRGEDTNGDGKVDVQDCRPGTPDLSQLVPELDVRYVRKPRDETDLTLRSLTTQGSLTTGGSTEVGGNLSVVGNADLFGDLAVAGRAELAGNLRVEGLTELEDLLVSGNADLLGDLTVGGLLSAPRAQIGQFLFADWLVVGEPTQPPSNTWALINPDNGPDLAIGPTEDPEGGKVESTVLYLSRDGKVGVGTANPREKLHVNGNVLVEGNLRVTGAKFFVQEHPEDPTQEVAFAAQEGPEVGVYARGQAELHEGEAIVELPEAFSLVASEERLTVQLTPIGEWLRLYVVELTPHKLVVREAQGKSATFFWRVEGVRKGYEVFQAIRPKE